MDITEKISDLFALLREIPAEKQAETIKLLESQTKQWKEAKRYDENRDVNQKRSTKDGKNKGKLKVEDSQKLEIASNTSNHGYNTRRVKLKKFDFGRGAVKRLKQSKVSSGITNVALKKEPEEDNDWKPPALVALKSPQKPKKRAKKQKDSVAEAEAPIINSINIKKEPIDVEDDVSTPNEVPAIDECDLPEATDPDTDTAALPEAEVKNELVNSKPIIKKTRLKDHRTLQEKCTCTICGKVLSTPQATKNHMHLHTDSIPYQCPLCDKKFRQSSALAIHKKKFHSSEKPAFQCNECDFSAVYGHMLKDHMNRMHLKSRDFLCSECGKGFLSKRMLKRHMEVHSDSGRLTCSLCNFRTHNSQCLRSHYRNRHSETPKLFICEICGCKLKYQGSYKAHMHRHAGTKPYKCDQCPASFASSSQQQSHMRTHRPPTEECSICNKKFLTKDHLRRHTLIHSGEKPFQCPRCSYNCNLEYNLRKHCQNRHQIVYPPMRAQYVKPLSDIGYKETESEPEGKTDVNELTAGLLDPKDLLSSDSDNDNDKNDNNSSKSETMTGSSELVYTVPNLTSNGDKVLLLDQAQVQQQQQQQTLAPLSQKVESSGYRETVVFQGSKVLSHVTSQQQQSQPQPLQQLQLQLPQQQQQQLHYQPEAYTQDEQVKFQVMEMTPSDAATLTASSEQVLYIVENESLVGLSKKAEHAVEMQAVDSYVIQDVHHEEVAEIVRAVQQHQIQTEQPEQPTDYPKFILS